MFSNLIVTHLFRLWLCCSLNYVMIKLIPSAFEGTQMLTDFLQIFDIMHIEDLLNIQSLLFFTPSATFLNNLLLLFMPFSTESTADVYIEECVNLLTDSRSIEVFELDEGLARFCVNGNFRRKCGLKEMCRAVIRARVLETKANGLTNQQRLNLIRTLQISLPIKNFLLFNYTSYDLR